MSKIGYIRVSTDEQSVENQKMKMKDLGIEKWFVDDGVSGTIRDRKALNEMIDYVRDIDTIYVVALDRLSRNTKDLEEIQAKIKSKGATILPLDILEKLGMKDIPSDITSKLIFDIMTVVSSFYAENERIRMLERQELGIARAKAEGKYKGGTIQYHKNSKGRNLIVYTEVFRMLAEKKPIKKIADTLKISKNTIYVLKKRAYSEMIDYVKLGKTNKEIAENLLIPENYVEEQVNKIQKELELVI